jgi:phosphoinositide-3-kinase regulatory subunit 4
MIDIEPTARPTFDTLLHTSRGTIFPESFYSFLHNYVSSINDLPSNPPFSSTAPSTAATPAIAPSISGSTIRPNSSLGLNPTGLPGTETPLDALPSDSDHRLERIWSDYESVEPYLVPDTVEETVMNVKVEYNSSTSMSKPFQVHCMRRLTLPN